MIMAWTDEARRKAAETRKRNAANRGPTMGARPSETIAARSKGVNFRDRQIVMPRDPFKDKLRAIGKRDELAEARARALKATAQSNGITVAQQQAKYDADRAAVFKAQAKLNAPRPTPWKSLKAQDAKDNAHMRNHYGSGRKSK